jgi:hypothetical protein
VVAYPKEGGNQMSVLEPAAQPGRVMIACGTVLSPEHREGFEKLDDDGKETFLWAFRHGINTHHADFQIDGGDGALDCPTRFQISATRYEDGLTLGQLRADRGRGVQDEAHRRLASAGAPRSSQFRCCRPV